MKFLALFIMLLFFTGTALANPSDQLAKSLSEQMGVPDKYRKTELMKLITLPIMPGSTMVFNRYNGLSFDDFATSLPFTVLLSQNPIDEVLKFYDENLTGFYKVVGNDRFVYFESEPQSLENHPVNNLDKIWIEIEPSIVDGKNVTLIKMNYQLSNV